MPSVICPLSYETVLDPNGRPLVGAKVYIFAAETTDQVQVYSDSKLTKPFAQPILTTGYGRVPAIYLPPGAFRIRLTDPQGLIMDDVDDVQGAVVTTEVNNITLNGFGAPTGALLPYYGTGAPAGWVRANGKTIGNAESSGSEFADDSTEALFIALWNADSTLAVSGGRGNTATADFLASKTIALPDLRRRALVGLDGMGNGFLNYTGNSADPFRTLGAQFGEETHVLGIVEMPTHSHVMSCDTEGGHIHNAACDLQGLHSHTATTDQQGIHSHTAATDIQGGHIHGTSMDQQGDHTHGAGMDNQGVHNHGATITAGGSHTHAVTCSSSGTHSHNYAYYRYNRDGLAPNGSSTGGFSNRDSENQNSGQTDSQGAHQHDIAIAQDGYHTHNITIQNAGGHVHTITVNNAGSHAHTVTLQDAGEHQHAITIQNSGQHAHNVTVNAAGQHQHNITISDAGEHTHIVTAQPVGGGAAHNNIQPSMPVTVLIKL